MFVATIRWEYRVRPAGPVMRFACISGMGEYRDLLRDPTTSSAWYFEPLGAVTAESRDAFELVQLAVNGADRTIRRTERRGAQVSVTLGKATASCEDVTISYNYRVLVQRCGYLLYLDLPRPAKGVHVRLDYGQADIGYVNVLDYFASPDALQVERSPGTAPAKTVDVSFDGQIFP
jgi:hypothetical protein